MIDGIQKVSVGLVFGILLRQNQAQNGHTNQNQAGDGRIEDRQTKP